METDLEEILKSIRRFIVTRDRCASEVRQHLERKKICPRDRAGAVIEYLQNAGLVDDRRFAANRVEYRLNQGYGPRTIQQELRRLRVTDEIISAALDLDERRFLDAARRILARKRDTLLRKGTGEPLDKLTRYLIGRGFAPAHARRILGGELEALE